MLYLNVLDALTTRTGLSLGFIEGNPVMALFGDGMYLFKALATVSIIVAILILRKRYHHIERVVVIGNGFLAVVVALNLAQLAVIL